MSSSKHAAIKQPSQHAVHFSFPPTQRLSLPASTASSRRSQNQSINLRVSCEKLIEALSVQPLRHAEAL